jgi:fucose permease
MRSTLKTKESTTIGLVIIVFIAFISLGLPDGLLGVAWPSIRAGFGIPLDAMGMLLFASMVGYLSSSFLSGKIVARLGIGRVLAISCGVTGLALIGYTLVPAWWMMSLLGIASGLGAGAIDAGLNTYVASHFKERVMQWLHACYGIGVTLGPLIMTAGLNYFRNWRLGYVVVGAAQLILALSFTFSLDKWNTQKDTRAEDAPKRLTDYDTSLLETLRQPMVWLSILLFFVYTGAEAALGVWVYSLLTESRGILPAVAGLLTGSYWIMFTFGRVLAGLYSKRISLHTLLYGSMFTALAGALLLLLDLSNPVSVIGVGLVGFAIAPIFPGLVSDTSSRVQPRFAANTIGMQLAGAGLGAASLPSLIGVLAENISLEVIPVVLVITFAVLLGLFALSVIARRVHQYSE